MYLTLLAQAAPGSASGVSVGISATVLAIIGAWWAFKRQGRDWPGAIIFTTFGVVMANTIVGELAWQLVDFAAQGIEMAVEMISSAAESV